LEVYRSRSLLRAEKWRWRLRAANGRIIATSGEGYTNYADCLAAGEAVVSGAYADAARVIR
jgi:uncharacterized protein YegP (UPF0339 family)